MLEKITQTTEYLRSKGIIDPEAGIILGTGLGGLVAEIKNAVIIDYSEIPNFPVSTVEGHDGKLIYGDFGSKKVLAMKGRFHFYEGYSMDEVVFPVRVMKFLGIKNLFLSNAAGGMNPEFNIGDIMLICDHINLIPNPLVGRNDDRIGVRFPDMSEPYDKKLRDIAKEVAAQMNIILKEGIYIGTTGPTFETPAEYKHFRIVGADAVGMSTVPEVIAARHMLLPCFAVSIITDLGIEGKIEPVTHKMVQDAAEAAEAKMTGLMTRILERI